MRYFSLLLAFLITVYTQEMLKAQTDVQTLLKEVTLEDIWESGTFRTERMYSLRSMKGDYYTLMNFDRRTRSSSIEKYSYKTLEKIATLIDSKDLDEVAYFESYTFNEDETKLLLATDTEPIYRHSEFAFFYVYDMKEKSLKKVADSKVQEATFSPNGNKVAYVYKNNIYIKDMTSDSTTQITFDGKKNHIINGISDWVYEEEFGFVRAFQWNTDGTALAFLRFDETEVSEFTMMKYGSELYPQPVTFKYPKAGEENSIVTLHIYDLNKKNTESVNLGNYEYIARIKWTKDANLLSAQTLNRRQNDLKLFVIDRNTAKASILLSETSDTYVNIRNTLTFLNDNSFIWRSEKDGYDHLYYYNSGGSLKNQITKGAWDITDFYGVDEKNKKVFYRSVEDGSIHKTVYAIGLDGKNKQRLSPPTGVNSTLFSKNRKYYINNFSDIHTPPVYTLHLADGTLLKEIKNNEALLKKLKGYNIAKKEFSTLTTKNGTFNMWMIKPTDFDPNKKYPLLLYQYSGPGSQSVQNQWYNYNDYWYSLLASKGYIIACVDGRGTGGRGTAFTKVTYKNLGKYETIDQIESAKELRKRPYIDADRIGIWGWSYGGFTSSNALFKGNGVFKMAIAVAQVSSWRLYDTIYTERYMQTPKENPKGYDDNSPLFFADRLKGNYLIVHGTGDDNVHVQNAMQMINALIEADVPFEMALYPDRTHSIYRGKHTRLHLYKKMTDFIEKNL